MLKQPDAIATFEDALVALQTSLAGDFADPDLAEAAKSHVGTHALAGANAAVAAGVPKNSETLHWLDAANGRAARQREAERLDQALKNAFHASEQLRGALDNFIAAIGPLGASGAAAAVAAADFRESTRDSAAKALDRGAWRKREILANKKVLPEPAVGTAQAPRFIRLQR